jgi:alanyl-tRNA synthetase
VLRVPAEQLPFTADRFFQEWKQRGKENEELKKKLTEARLQATKKSSAEAKDDEVKSSKPLVKEIKLGSEHIKILSWIIDADIKELLHTSQGLLKENAVAILGGVSSGQAHIVITVRSDIAKEGVDAALIVKEASKILGGSGGGRLERAQGGGPFADKISEAVHKALRLVSDRLEEIEQRG